MIWEGGWIDDNDTRNVINLSPPNRINLIGHWIDEYDYREKRICPNPKAYLFAII